MSKSFYTRKFVGVAVMVATVLLVGFDNSPDEKCFEFDSETGTITSY